jgi:hypothetical protein
VAKTVYGWVVDWNDVTSTNTGDRIIGKEPKVTIDLFFSSREKFNELVYLKHPEQEILVPCVVDDSFDELDFIPDNY